MKRKKLTALITGFALIAAAMTGCGSAGSSKTDVRIGAGGTGGTYYKYVEELGILTAAAHSDVNIEVKSTAGSSANLRLLEKGFVDMAIVQGDILESAFEGSGIYTEVQELSGISAVSALYTEAVQLVVRTDSGISSVADLAGKDVSLGEEESGVRQNAEQILEANGLKESDINPHYMSFTDSADAMRSGTIDACFITAGAPTSAVSELAKDLPVSIISLDNRTIETLEGLYDSYVTVKIPAGTYEGQNIDVTTIGVKAVLVASNAVSDDTVKKILSTVFERQSVLQDMTATDGELTPEFASSNIAIPFHKGAASYFASENISVTETDGKLPTSVSGTQDD